MTLQKVDNSMTEPDGQAWGGPARMSASEAVMWRAEGDLRTRSSGLLLEILDSVPDWERFRSAHGRAVQAIPRLRDRVVEPLLPVVAPTWTPDENFDLSYHVQRMRLPAPGSMADLLELAGQVASRPLDTNRPQWEAILVDGLEGGRAGYLFKIHHAMTDGLGIVQLLTMAHSPTPEPGGTKLSSPTALPPRSGPEITPLSLVTDELRDQLLGAPARFAGNALSTLGLVGRTLRDPAGVVGRAVDYGLSLRRMLNPSTTERSALLSEGGYGYRVVVHDVPLASLKAAGKAAGGSVNDAFLASLLGAFRLYHDHFGTTPDQLPMAIPISLRDSNDPMGGNRFTGARFAAPMSEPDPRIRIQLIREFILTIRKEPAVGFLETISSALTLLPSAALTEIVGNLTRVSDLQASNIPGIGHPVYLAGAQVQRMYPIGPRPGVAAMVAMVSYDGTCCLGINVDPESITDVPLFEKCLNEGFAEVLALGS